MSDEPGDLDDLVRRLRSAGYQVEVRSTPDRAYQFVREQRPALVILAIGGDHTSGWDVLQALNLDPVTAKIPVLLCSPVARRRVQASGAIRAAGGDVFPLPFTPDDVVRRVGTLLRRHAVKP